MSQLTSSRYEVRAGWDDQNRLIGWLSFPRKKSSSTDENLRPSSGTFSSSSFRPSAPRSTGCLTSGDSPRFEYAPAWLQDGFALGADLPLVAGAQTPLPGHRGFGFLRDRLPSAEAETLLLSHPTVRESDALAGASRLEMAAVALPASAVAYGGLLFYGLDDELSPLPVHHVDTLPDLIYAIHAFERGKLPDKEAVGLTESALVADDRLSLTLISQRRPVSIVVPSVSDPIDVPFWRAFGLRMAKACGIDVVETAFEKHLGESVLRLERADRQVSPVSSTLRDVVRPAKLMTCASAATLTERLDRRTDRATAVSYLAIADILNREGAAPAEDLPKLWDRLVYTLLTNRAGDRADRWHFYRTEHGWRPLPAHNLEWLPASLGTGRGLRLTADGRRPLLEAEDALALAPYFALRQSDAKMRLFAIRRTLFDWEAQALDAGAAPGDIALMASLFD